MTVNFYINGCLSQLCTYKDCQEKTLAIALLLMVEYDCKFIIETASIS